MDPTETAKATGARLWQCPPEQVFSEDVSSFFPWAKHHAIVLVKNIAHETVLVVVPPDGEATPVGAAQDLGVLNRVLKQENVRLPEGMPPRQLALSVRFFLAGPGGFVADKEFFARNKRFVELAARDDAEKLRLFEQSCREPELQRREDLWRLDFRYFNNRGGVEQWNAEGDVETIRNAVSKGLAPDRTFSLPYG